MLRRSQGPNWGKVEIINFPGSNRREIFRYGNTPYDFVGNICNKEFPLKNQSGVLYIRDFPYFTIPVKGIVQESCGLLAKVFACCAARRGRIGEKLK